MPPKKRKPVPRKKHVAKKPTPDPDATGLCFDEEEAEICYDLLSEDDLKHEDEHSNHGQGWLATPDHVMCCAYGNCHETDTPILLTIKRTASMELVHFCSLVHLALWAKKEAQRRSTAGLDSITTEEVQELGMGRAFSKPVRRAEDAKESEMSQQPSAY